MATDSSFFENVFDVVRLIPEGRVTSYGHIAAYLGSKSAARMVGWAMNSSHSAPQYVPAHRVVNRQGLLTGRHHFNPPESMEAALVAEGIQVKDDQIVDFEKYLWDPSVELAL
jgi:methylated-DNA-protein-cysteine methyltransferase-like protein